MKFLLTSCGMSNDSIRNTLVDLLAVPFKNLFSDVFAPPQREKERFADVALKRNTCKTLKKISGSG